MKKKHIIIGVMVFLFVLLFLENMSSATSIDDIFKQGSNFITNGESGNIDADMNEVGKMSGVMYRAIYFLFLPMAIIVGIALGIKYMLAATGEKASIKQSMITYLVSVVILFGGYGIWELIIKILS